MMMSTMTTTTKQIRELEEWIAAECEELEQLRHTVRQQANGLVELERNMKAVVQALVHINPMHAAAAAGPDRTLAAATTGSVAVKVEALEVVLGELARDIGAPRARPLTHHSSSSCCEEA